MTKTMLTLQHQTNHPNGFKILLATRIFKKKLQTIDISKSIASGASLTLMASNGVDSQLNANNAVLYLGSSELSDPIVAWLQWESQLQGTLYPYLRTLLAKKEEKSLIGPIEEHLAILNAALPETGGYFNQTLSAIDIVCYGSLSLLVKSKNFGTVLKSKPKVSLYLKFLKSLPEFEESEKNYYILDSSNPALWLEQSVVAITRSKLTWSLLKTAPSKPTGTVKEENPDKKYNFKDAELVAAKQLWAEGFSVVDKPASTVPILPVKGQRNTLITAALPYVNNVPHLGNIIGCVLSADVFARFCRMRGDNIIYICGTDEYGTATETKALAEGLTPAQICDKYNAIHKSVYEWFNIEFDHFGRTTGPNQELVAHEVFWDLEKNGNILRNAVEQLYCVKCEKFLADRFVEGKCPHPGCQYDDARGDQCDKCGKLVNATDLIEPRCKVCSASPVIKTSSHLFLDLPKIEKQLKQWVDKSSPQWTTNAKGICDSWIRDGLKERCITRDLKWGTKVPLEGYTGKVFYVWYDAPLGYVSITKDYTDQWQMWWKNPEEVSYYEFMAKDNVPFHSVIFPACQLATNQKWTMVTHLMATEYLNYEDGKFSKSRQLGVFGDQAKDTGIPSDVWRFYLLYIRPESQDTSFSWVDLQTKNNSELLNNLGNFVNRALKFVDQFFGGVIPAATLTSIDLVAIASVNVELETYKSSLSGCKLREGLRNILAITRIGNQYIQDNEPFKLVKPACSEAEKARGATIIHVAANIVALVAILLQPYMPTTSKKILEFLNLSGSNQQLPRGMAQMLPGGHKINKPHPLIEKISDELIEKLKKDFGGKATPADNSKPIVTNASPEELEAKVAEQGSKVRTLKTGGAPKDEVTSAVAELLRLKQALAISQGIDPATLSKDKKKNKKK